MLSMKFRKIPSGVEKMKINKSRRIKPYCSSIIIVSVRIGRKVKSNFEPSSGGNGMRLKNASSTFQKITIMRIAKNIEPIEPEIAAESCSHEVPAIPEIIAILTALEIGINLAMIAATTAIAIFEPGPPKATRAGPHF